MVGHFFLRKDKKIHSFLVHSSGRSRIIESFAREKLEQHIFPTAVFYVSRRTRVQVSKEREKAPNIHSGDPSHAIYVLLLLECFDAGGRKSIHSHFYDDRSN